MAKITIEETDKGLVIQTDGVGMSLALGMLNHALVVYQTHIAEDARTQKKRSKREEPKTDAK